MLEQGTSFGPRGPVRLSWPADPRSLSLLRFELRAWLSTLGFDVDVADDIVLAANEAAANAIDHAYPATDPVGVVEMNLWVDDSVVHVQVVDHGRWRDVDPAPSYRGLGLPLMRALLKDIGVESGTAGTAVLLRHPLPGAV